MFNVLFAFQESTGNLSFFSFRLIRIMSRVFVVTGSNKGIGKSIVKLLLQDKGEKIVYLTSRNKEAGEQVVKEFENEGLKPKYHQLDITDRKSIESLRDHLLENYGGFDVLVNNAGIAYKGNSTVPFGEQAEVSVACNFYGTLDACEILFPILKKNGRNVNLSSYGSEIAYNFMSEDMKKKFANPSLTMQGVNGITLFQCLACDYCLHFKPVFTTESFYTNKRL